MKNTILTEYNIARERERKKERERERGGRLLDISKFYISGAVKGIAIRRQSPAFYDRGRNKNLRAKISKETRTPATKARERVLLSEQRYFRTYIYTQYRVSRCYSLFCNRSLRVRRF